MTTKKTIKRLNAVASATVIEPTEVATAEEVAAEAKPRPPARGLLFNIYALDAEGEPILDPATGELNEIRIIFSCPEEAPVVDKQASLILFVGKLGAISSAILQVPSPGSTGTVDAVVEELFRRKTQRNAPSAASDPEFRGKLDG
jgi:hypothetical protein